MSDKRTTADQPEIISQKGPFPMQGTFEPRNYQKDVPYVSGKPTPNKNVK